MNDLERHSAIQIMTKLIQHPITAIFHRSFDTTNGPKGCTAIQSPYSLLNIQKRLVDSQFSSMSDWKNEIESCWNNALKYKDQNKNIFAAAEECQKIFNKLTKSTHDKSLKSWCDNIYELETLKLELDRHAPKRVHQLACHLDAYNQLKDEKLTPLSNGELKAFIQAGNCNKSEDINRGLVKILNELQPDIEKQNNSTELWVDVTKLEFSTINALRDYLKKELPKQGITFYT